MFYTGLDPYTLEPVYVAKDPSEKAMQRVLLQYYKPENQRKVIEALIKAGRRDLIGHGEGKLVAPDAQYAREQREYEQSQQRGKRGAPSKGAARNARYSGNERGKRKGKR